MLDLVEGGGDLGGCGQWSRQHRLDGHVVVAGGAVAYQVVEEPALFEGSEGAGRGPVGRSRTARFAAAEGVPGQPDPPAVPSEGGVDVEAAAPQLREQPGVRGPVGRVEPERVGVAGLAGHRLARRARCEGPDDHHGCGRLLRVGGGARRVLLYAGRRRRVLGGGAQRGGQREVTACRGGGPGSRLRGRAPRAG